MTLPKENPFLQDDNVVWDAAEGEMSDVLPAFSEMSGTDTETVPVSDIPKSDNDAKDCVLLVEDNADTDGFAFTALSGYYCIGWQSRA